MENGTKLFPIDTADGNPSGDAYDYTLAETMITISHSVGLAMETSVLSQISDHPISNSNMANAVAALLGKQKKRLHRRHLEFFDNKNT